jgi:hypothetical protein
MDDQAMKDVVGLVACCKRLDGFGNCRVVLPTPDVGRFDMCDLIAGERSFCRKARKRLAR